MFGLLNLELYLYFILFLIAVSFSWLIPGWVALSVVKLKNTSLRFILSMPVGMALWGIQGYLFGYGQVRFLTYFYIAIFGYLFWKEQNENNFSDFKIVFNQLKKQPHILIAFIAVSTFIQIYGHIGSGLLTPEGLPFYFVNSVDGVLHLSYIQELTHTFPPQEPGAVGIPLQNYHYWSDLVQAELIRVWHIPTINLFFQYAPILIATWTTVLFLRLISYLGGSKKAQWVGLFLLTFGGDAAYTMTQVLHGHWGVDVSSLDSGVSFYFNIPQVYARFVFLASIFLLSKWWKNRSIKTGLLLATLIASLFGFKVYYALYAVFGFCFVIGFEMTSELIKNFKNNSIILAFTKTIEASKKSIFLIVATAVISLSIYLPVNKAAGGLTYSFFEWPHLLLSATNIEYADWFLRMQVYEAYGNTRNIILFNLLAVLLTFVAVYGTRMLGFFPLFKVKNENLKRLLLFFIPANILFVLLGLFTLQTSGGLNIFNFLIVPIFSFNLIAALNLSKLKNKFFIPVFIVFAILTVPRSFLQLKMYYLRYYNVQPDSFITNDQLEGYEFLKIQENVVVQKSMEEDYNYQTTYVSFMSGHPTYIGGISMLESHNQPTVERQNQVTDALSKGDVNLKASLLKGYGITHFITTTTEANMPNKWLSEIVFQNETVTIYKL
jgi:hypothetical protein